MKTLIWLDDIRDPHINNHLQFAPIEQPYDVKWIKSYNEFEKYINAWGLPDAICFDHDLAEEHYEDEILMNMTLNSKEDYLKLINSFSEKTGYHCARYLIEYCITNGKQLPLYHVHSANPVGKMYINKLLKAYDTRNI